MAKKELIANDPLETKLMAFSETVHKIALVVILAVLAAGILFGIAVAESDLLVFAAILIPCAVFVLLVWLAKELICLWLEYQTEMHCYARTQTEILMGKSEKE